MITLEQAIAQALKEARQARGVIKFGASHDKAILVEKLQSTVERLARMLEVCKGQRDNWIFASSDYSEEDIGKFEDAELISIWNEGRE